MKKFLITFLFLFSFTFSSFNQEEVKYVKNEEINYLNLYNEILEQELEFPDIVFAQAVLESGSFTSKVFKSNKNLFGMRLPSRRPTLAVGKKYGYAVYNCWEESVGDYALYQEHYFKNKKISKSQYLAYIDRTYSETNGYVGRLKRIVKEYSKILYEPPSNRNDGEINYLSYYGK